MKIPNAISMGMAFLLAAGMAAGVWADSDVAPQELSLEAGAAFPTAFNNFSDQEKIGLIGGARYLRMISSKFGWGVQADYYHFSAKTHPLTDQYGAVLNTRSWDNVATAEIMGRYSILPDAIVVPYFHSGVGVTYFHQMSEGSPAVGAGWPITGTAETRQLQDTSSVGFSYSAGFGAETYLTKSLVLGLEATWRIFGVSQTDFGTSTIGIPNVSMRLGWRFGHFAADPFTDKPAH